MQQQNRELDVLRTSLERENDRLREDLMAARKDIRCANLPPTSPPKWRSEPPPSYVPGHFCPSDLVPNLAETETPSVFYLVGV